MTILVGLGDTMGLQVEENELKKNKIHSSGKEYLLNQEQFLFWMIAKSAKCTLNDVGMMLNVSQKKLIDMREFLKRNGLLVEWSEKKLNLNSLKLMPTGFVTGQTEDGQQLVKTFPREEPIILTEPHFSIWKLSGEHHTLAQIYKKTKRQHHLTPEEFLEAVLLLLRGGFVLLILDI